MIEKIIFDYGGVFTSGSRTNFVARSLSSCGEKQEAILEFFASKFIIQAAEGKRSTTQILSRLQVLLGDTDVDKIHDVMMKACNPDPRISHILKQLKDRYRVYLISDSLPPYSEYLEQNFTRIFDGCFFSDQMGARKSGQLYSIVESACPGLFSNAVYIDDRESNLPAVVSRGCVGLHFKSPMSLIEDLGRLGIFVYGNHDWGSKMALRMHNI